MNILTLTFIVFKRERKEKKTVHNRISNCPTQGQTKMYQTTPQKVKLQVVEKQRLTNLMNSRTFVGSNFFSSLPGN